MTTSAELFDLASRHIPGGVNSPVRAFKGLHRPPVFMERAQGAYLFDVEGNRYVDRFVAENGKIVKMDVWNDSAERILTTRAARPEPAGAQPLRRASLA